MKFPIIFKSSILISEIPLTQKNALLVAEDSTVKFIQNKIDFLANLLEIVFIKSSLILLSYRLKYTQTWNFYCFIVYCTSLS